MGVIQRVAELLSAVGGATACTGFSAGSNPVGATVFRATGAVRDVFRDRPRHPASSARTGHLDFDFTNAKTHLKYLAQFLLLVNYSLPAYAISSTILSSQDRSLGESSRYAFASRLN